MLKMASCCLPLSHKVLTSPLGWHWFGPMVSAGCCEHQKDFPLDQGAVCLTPQLHNPQSGAG